jgi:DNA-binding NarL/FixJ family response regulator
MIKVLIVDDQKTVQELLKSYLEQAPDLEIVGIASNGQIAIEQVEASRPDVILMDIEMPVIDGLTATKIIAEQFVETKILILSVHDTDTYLNKALQVGAKGYLLKNTPPEELIKAIYSVRKNYFQLGPGLLEKYLYKLASSGSNVTELDSLKVMVIF